MPTLRLTGARSAKPAATPSRKRKPAAKAKAAPKRTARNTKPAATQATAASNGAATRGPKLPEGWTNADFKQVVKDMQRARAAREKADAELSEARRAANALALYLLDNDIQMSVINVELDLSRQWMYTLLKDREEGRIDDEARPIEQAPARKAAAKRTAKKPAAKKRPAAAKTAPARKRPAKKAPARKRPTPAPAVTGRGRVRLAV